MLGEVLLNSSSSSGDSGGILGSVEGGLSSLENDLKNDLNGAIHSIAQALDIHDFYSAHIMDFCEGYYEPGPLANATVTPSKNVTDCSNSTSGYNFDPQAILQSQLKSGVTLDDLHWPKELEDAIQAAETAVKAMFVLYCIGVAFAGLAFLGAIFAFFTDGRIGAFVDATLSFVRSVTTLAIIRAANINLSWLSLPWGLRQQLHQHLSSKLPMRSISTVKMLASLLTRARASWLLRGRLLLFSS